MFRQETQYKGDPITLIWHPGDTITAFTPATQSAGFCFTADGKLLVVRQKRWGLPGGSIEVGESPAQALVREVDEEASVTLRHYQLLGAVEVLYPHNKNHAQGERFFQLRYAAIIDEIRPLHVDPCTGTLPERMFIDPATFGAIVPWGSLGDMLRDAAVEWYKRQR